jgi:hypothetical protein
MSCKGLYALAVIMGMTLFAAVGFGAQEDAGPAAFSRKPAMNFLRFWMGQKLYTNLSCRTRGTQP